MKRTMSWLVLLAGIAMSVFWLYATRYDELPLTDSPKASAFSKETINQGRRLARVGNCRDCHSRDNGKPYSGGRPMLTEFGTIYTSNLTPELETGIGGWSFTAFLRAMQEGVDRHGQFLYPAFPYDRFTKMSEKDIAAIYAFIITSVKPVNYDPPKTQLNFPWNIRNGLSLWNLLFLDKTKWQADPARNEEWNTGSYIVEGIAHCGSCHSPRNILGAEKRGSQVYSGGYSGNWYAPKLFSDPSSVSRFTMNSIVNYLLDGWDKSLGIAAGPMTKVVNNLYDGEEDDAFAIATYIKSLRPTSNKDDIANFEKKILALKQLEWGNPNSPPLPRKGKLEEGANVFKKQCSKCHKSGRKTSLVGFVGPLNHNEPYNVINVILEGIKPPLGSLKREMPSRKNEINNTQLVSLLMFLRSRFSTKEPWPNLELKIAKIRSQ